MLGVGFAIDAASKKSSYSDHPNGEVALAGERSALLADLSFAATALFGITAAALYFIRDEEPSKGASASGRSRPQWVAAPTVLPQGGGVSAAVRF